MKTVYEDEVTIGDELLESSVLTEVVFVSEPEPGEVLVVVNEDFFSIIPETDRQRMLDAFFILSLQQLAQDLEACGEELVEPNPNPVYNEVFIAFKLCLTYDNEFRLLTYFGGRVSDGHTVKEGLLHSMKLFSELRTQYKKV